MGIDFNINITRKIKVNGKEYDSLEEVPQEHRQAVQDALGAAGTGAPGKININGTGYDSPEAMPPEARRIYDESLGKARALAQEKGIDLAAFGIKPGPDGQPAPEAEPGLSIQLNLNAPPGAPAQEGGLSLRTTVILAILAALALLLIFFAPK